MIYSLTTDRQPVIPGSVYWAKITCKQDSISIITHKNDKKTSVSFRCFQTSAVREAFICIRKFLMREYDVTLTSCK